MNKKVFQDDEDIQIKALTEMEILILVFEIAPEY